MPEAEKITAILEAGRLAPTAKNLQEQHIYVLQSEESLKKLDSVTPCRYGAPVVLVVAFDKNNVFTYPGEKRDSGVEDATIVATQMILAAANEGVDSCWINFFDPDKLAQALALPENEEVNITEPTAKEIQAINPYVFLDLYKKGYDITMRQSTLRGVATYEVHLVAKRSDMAAQELYIDVRQSDYMPLCVRVRQDRTWNRISIRNFSGNQKFSEADFTFPREKYPDAEIIDLR